jgi:ABC-type histidine transport system ATPase subunit
MSFNSKKVWKKYDGRATNHRPQKWDQPIIKRKIGLTDKAMQYLKKLGGAEWLEVQARALVFDSKYLFAQYPFASAIFPQLSMDGKIRRIIIQYADREEEIDAAPFYREAWR